jgi:hypothetical protein
MNTDATCISRPVSRKHELKTWPEFFVPVLDGRKTFEIRKNDRDFQVGDCLELYEWHPKVEAYTGRATVRYVSYITAFGQYPGYVVMGLSTTRPATPNPPSATAGE